MRRISFARKLDGAGRLVIPSKIREAFRMEEGDLYQFFIHKEGDDVFLAVKCYPEAQPSSAQISEDIKKLLTKK